MKRCPNCRRDYYDDMLMFCLDGGAMLDHLRALDEMNANCGGGYEVEETK